MTIPASICIAAIVATVTITFGLLAMAVMDFIALRRSKKDLNRLNH